LVKGKKGRVKLQKRFAYKYNDEDHFKHILTIPEELINELGWKHGQELEPYVKDGKLVFEQPEPEGKRR
jgi:hypothetical protein